MTLKTAEDCAQCSNIKICDAHMTDGQWKHKEGIDPCIFVDKSEANGF
jgi:hypothetical protein